MKKISIVGVEGSGKTVLMSVLGEKYAVPDANGLSLKAKKAETFAFCTSTVAAMRTGVWPSATLPGELSKLEWQLLCQKGASGSTTLGEVTMLDFAGEIYRQAFGMNQVEEESAEDVKALREHVSRSDILVVLVNLKDVIDGDRTQQRTIDMLWLSQSICDYAKARGVRHIALAFSQADRYAKIIDECGGVKSAFKRYLPHVAYAFPQMPVFAVSAVDGIVLKNGYDVPAGDFQSRGLSEMMAWLRSCVLPVRIPVKNILIFSALLGMSAALIFGWPKKPAETSKGDVGDQTRQALDAFAEGRWDDGFAFSRNADRDNGEIQFYLGVVYACGQGAGRDYSEALKWFRKSAGQGHVVAQYNLGVMHEKGRGVNRDSPEALKWFLRSAEKGYVDAQYNLGVMYALGRQGVPRDGDEAAKWYRKAAAKGDAEAKRALERLKK